MKHVKPLNVTFAVSDPEDVRILFILSSKKKFDTKTFNSFIKLLCVNVKKKRFIDHFVYIFNKKSP